MANLTRLTVPGSAQDWSALGFHVGDDAFRAGAVAVRVDAKTLGWGFDEVRADTLVVPTEVVPPPDGEPSPNPNLIDRVDHVVYTVRTMDPAIDAFKMALGLEPRKRGHPRPGGPEMAFFRAGEAVIEVVALGSGPQLWGVAFATRDLAATVDAVRASGGEISDPKDAIQGGLIASVPTRWTGIPVAVMQVP